MQTTTPEAHLMRRALRLLSQRDYSRAELTHALSTAEAGHPVPAAAIEATLTRLLAQGILSDYRKADAIARRHAHKGDAVIRQRLKQAGIGTACSDEVIAALPSERERAQAAAQKKYTTLSAKRPQQVKQKLLAFLLARGFNAALAYEVAQAVCLINHEYI